MKSRIGGKIFLTLILFGIAIVGFMVKLPTTFRGHDREMHAVFYFCAAAFLNILFAKRNLLIHSVIFALLYLFGVSIEYAQEYSNSYFHARLHGRYDPEDIAWNLKGLIAFSVLWLIYAGTSFLFKTNRPEKAAVRSDPDATVPGFNSGKAAAADATTLGSFMPVADLATTINYYEKVLGFSISHEPEKVVAYAQKDSIQLCFIEETGYSYRGKNKSEGPDLVWVVKNIDQLYRQWNANNEVVIINELSTNQAGRRIFELLDNNHYHVLVVEYQSS